MNGIELRKPSALSAPYWSMLRGLSRPVRLELIALLSNSLASEEDEAEELVLTEDERKAGLMSLAGCWSDDPKDAARMEAATKECREHDTLRDVNLDE